MLRRPFFWIAFIVFSIACAIFTFRNFSTAFPLVSIDLKMDRAAALRDARSMAEQNRWPSSGFAEAAEFSTDQEVQNFIELEGGGKPELKRILEQKIFAPYTWHVRFFKEGDAHETLVRFTPEGAPYGFVVKLPDQEKGSSLSSEEAQRIAEETAKSGWNIDFSRYPLAESSKDVRPGGRTDHTFVYERQDERAGDGRYRLRLVVGGDKLTDLTRFMQIPEAFSRRYEQMRSANDAINAVSTVAVIGLYILGFCGIGLFFMIRQHRVIWRPAALWGAAIAALMGLQQLNSWPLIWMSYDTAVPATGFAIRQIMGAFGIFGAFAIILTISFTAAETLSRRAFPLHPQLWKIWSRPVAASKPILGRTAAGYLMVAPFFAYEIVLYFFAQEKLGWWTPSDTLVNPDMFANYVPSLSAISQAAQAGFWEECLFRAVPLATAALIGEKLGRRRAFVVGGMILQALVFGAGHAGYANQPAYARVVELVIPSLAFGTVYLLFGLLPGIVLHFAYDTVWMALPLFVSSGARAHVEQVIVAFAVLVPLWVVLVKRTHAGTSSDLPENALNGAWKPPDIVEEHPPAQPAAVVTSSISSSVLRWLPLAGVAGLIAWTLFSPFRTDAPPVRVTRTEAVRQAREALRAKETALDSSWTVLSYVEGQPGEINRFVWQTAGRDVYRKLLGVYVTPPSWVVRFVRFHGDVAERAEEYQVYIRGSGGVFRISHDLPEAMPGENLNIADARMLAQSALEEPRDAFEEVSAQASKRPARTDWTFIFKDKRDYGLPQGEARISVGIAGNEVADIARYVYVPQEWSRNERARRNLPSIVTVVCTIIIVAIAAAAAIAGAIYWSRRRPFSVRAFLAVTGIVFLLGALNLINNWPVVAAQSSTAQSLEVQMSIAFVTSLVFGVFTAAGLGLVAGLVQANVPRAGLSLQPSLRIGISLGLAVAGAASAARSLGNPMSPFWGSLGPASTFVPFLGAALGPVGTFFTQTFVLLAVLYAAGHSRRAAAIWIVVGLAVAGLPGIDTIPSWLMIGTATGIILMIAYRLVFQHQPALLVITAATMVMLFALRDAVQHAFPAAVAGFLTGSALVAIAAWTWFRGSMNKL
jgi:hypothetical protein